VYLRAFLNRAGLAILVCFSSQVVFAQSTNLLPNSSFEQSFQRGGWTFPLDTEKFGTFTRLGDWTHSGDRSLNLFPNSMNSSDWQPFEYGIGHELSAEAYRGKQLYFGGWMRAKGGAVAVIRLLAVLDNGEILFREVRHDSSTPTFWRDVFDVPDRPVRSLIFTCSVEGTTGTAAFDDVIVSTELAATVTMGQFDPGPPLQAFIGVDASTIVRRIPRTLYGMNLEWVFDGHTLWDRDHGRLNERLTGLASDLNVSLWRYPGGVFANHYFWKNGIGPQELRPIPKIEPQSALSQSGFGTDEAFDFTARTGASDMMITVNSHTGTAEDAAEWVRYANNGFRRATYWEIGNELYLRTVDNNNEIRVWTPEEYRDSFLQFAAAMRAVDPEIKIGADVEYHYPFFGCSRNGETGRCWTDIILSDAASQLDFLSIHNGFAPIGLAPLGGGELDWDIRTVYSAMLSFPVLLKKMYRELGEKIDTLAGEHASRIKIGVSEWGPLFNVSEGSRMVDHVKTLASALYTASVFQVFLQDERIETAVAFKLLDESVFGWLGPRGDQYVIKAPYYAFQMYSKHFLPNLVTTTTDSPSYDSKSVLGIPAIQKVPFLDVVSSVNDEGDTLSMIVVNKHFDRSIQTAFAFRGFEANGSATAWTLTGTGIDANTGTSAPPSYAPQDAALPDNRFGIGGPGEIWVESTSISVFGSSMAYEFPPHSVTALVVRGRPVAETISFGEAARSVIGRLGLPVEPQ
jgi:alpha-L-arabinofuranosidase